MEKLNSPKFSDFWWDTAKPEDRDKVILNEQVIPTVLFAKENVPFFKEHYKHLSQADIQKISSMDEFADMIPYLTKEHLSKNSQFAFVPEVKREIDPNHGEFWSFGTGGSTGKPIKIFHSMEDWRGMSITANRHIEFDFYMDPKTPDIEFKKGKFKFEGIEARKTPMVGMRILGAYHGDHITNHIYGNMFHRLGGQIFGRPSATADIVDLYDMSQTFKVNGILAPPEGEYRQKGSFLVDILELDAKNRNPEWDLSHKHNPDFKFAYWSSMPISEGLLDYLKDDLQVPYIKGHFGSTEVCPTAATCSAKMRNFHLTLGQSLVLIKSLEKPGLAKPNESGYTLTSKIAGTDKKGNNVVPSGMYFINYMTGDGAKLSKNGLECKCGRNTPILYDIKRLGFHKGKALHGCQIN